MISWCSPLLKGKRTYSDYVCCLLCLPKPCPYHTHTVPTLGLAVSTWRLLPTLAVCFLHCVSAHSCKAFLLLFRLATFSHLLKLNSIQICHHLKTLLGLSPYTYSFPPLGSLTSSIMLILKLMYLISISL